MTKLQTRNLGEFKLRETESSQMFYVTVDGTYIFVTTQFPSYANEVGKIRVYHDGMYFGTQDEMYEWIENSVIDHLIGENIIVPDGETAYRERCWKWA